MPSLLFQAEPSCLAELTLSARVRRSTSSFHPHFDARLLALGANFTRLDSVVCLIQSTPSEVASLQWVGYYGGGFGAESGRIRQNPTGDLPAETFALRMGWGPAGATAQFNGGEAFFIGDAPLPIGTTHLVVELSASVRNMHYEDEEMEVLVPDVKVQSLNVKIAPPRNGLFWTSLRSSYETS